MDCLFGFVELAEEGKKYEALSLECNISASGDSKDEAVSNLASSLRDYIPEAIQNGVMPFVHPEENIERLMKYCAEKGIPEAFDDIDLSHSMKLCCYDLTR